MTPKARAQTRPSETTRAGYAWRTAVLAAGVWAAACSSTDQQPNHGDAGNPSNASAGSVGAGGASAAASAVTGGTATATAGATGATGATATGPATATAVTGTGGATSTTSGATTTTDQGTTSDASTVTTTSGGGAASVTSDMTTTGSSTTGSSDEESCASRPVLAVAKVTDFENYDGATVALDWSFAFNDDGTGMSLLYGGFFDNSDGTGTPSLSMVGGDNSSWAAKAANTEASDWGGGMGLWLGCSNASSFTGISLAVRGSTPNSNAVDVAISVDGLTGGVRTTIFVTDLLQTFQLPFTDFTNEYEETTNGDNIVGLAINAVMVWVQDETTEEWNVTPGAYEIIVDDISFY